MENKNKYMYICRKCGQTFSSDSNYDRDCPDCKNALERMPISRNEWIMLSDVDKENYKYSFLSQTKSITDKKYIYKSATPLAWHTFTRFFRVPFTFLQLFVNFNTGNYDVFTVAQCILIILFFIGSFSWAKYAWFCIIASDAITILINLINCLLTGFDASYLGSFLGACISCGLEIYYYSKRKALFNGSKEDPVETFEFKPNYSTNEYSSNSVHNDLNKQEPNTIRTISEQSKNETDGAIKFCKNCGAKLKEDAGFCHNCGTKIR